MGNDEDFLKHLLEEHKLEVKKCVAEEMNKILDIQAQIYAVILQMAEQAKEDPEALVVLIEMLREFVVASRLRQFDFLDLR